MAGPGLQLTACVRAGPVAFESTNGTERANAAMLDTLRGMAKKGMGKPSLGKVLSKYSLEEAGLAKVRGQGSASAAALSGGLHELPGCKTGRDLCAAR